MTERQFIINAKRRTDYQYRKLGWFDKFVVNSARIMMGIGRYKTGYKDLLEYMSDPKNKEITLK